MEDTVSFPWLCIYAGSKTFTHSHNLELIQMTAQTINKSYYNGNRRKGVSVCGDEPLVKRPPHASMRARVQTPRTE